MKRNACSLGSVVFLLSSALMLLAPDPSPGAIYKYKDKNGTVIFTDCYECIPQAYRHQVEKMREVEPPAAAPEAGKETAPRDDRKAVKTEPRPAPDDEGAAEKSGRGERGEKKKPGAIREKEERLETLRTRLQAALQERASLRTNWMVFDRIRTNQLNQEIESIRKEMDALQAGIQEEQP